MAQPSYPEIVRLVNKNWCYPDRVEPVNEWRHASWQYLLEATQTHGSRDFPKLL